MCRPNGQLRWCIGAAAASIDATDNDRAHQRRDRRYHRSQGGRGAPSAAGTRGRPPSPECARARAIDRAADPGGHHQGLYRRRGGPHRARCRARTCCLPRSRWQGADLARLVDEELAPYRWSDAEKIAAVGPDVLLEPATAQTLALALHELATNAAKYGALSLTSGRVRWRGSCSRKAWSCAGSRAADRRPQPPVSQGFGIKSDQREHRAPARGPCSFDWRPEGLHCSLRVPLGDNIEPTGAPSQRPSRGGRGQRPLCHCRLDSGNRILLVEDEMLVGMMMRDMLTELGFSVIGPFSRLAEAMVAAVHDDIDAGSSTSISTANWSIRSPMRWRRGTVPFVFVTGYRAEGIDGGSARCPSSRSRSSGKSCSGSSSAPAAANSATLPKRYGGGRVGRAATAGRS